MADTKKRRIVGAAAVSAAALATVLATQVSADPPHPAPGDACHEFQAAYPEAFAFEFPGGQGHCASFVAQGGSLEAALQGWYAKIIIT